MKMKHKYTYEKDISKAMIFNGRKYYFGSLRDSKSAAITEAKAFRRDGYYARVVKTHFEDLPPRWNKTQWGIFYCKRRK